MLVNVSNSPAARCQYFVSKMSVAKARKPLGKTCISHCQKSENLGFADMIKRLLSDREK